MYQQPVQQFGMYPGPQQAQHLHMQQYQMQQMQMQQMHMQQMQMQVRTASEQALCTHSCIDVHLQEVVIMAKLRLLACCSSSKWVWGNMEHRCIMLSSSSNSVALPMGLQWGRTSSSAANLPQRPELSSWAPRRIPPLILLGYGPHFSCCVIALCVDT